MVQIVQGRVRPLGAGPRRDALPVVKTALYTLDISGRFLIAAAMRRGSIAVADRLIDGYWRRIFQSGNCRLLVTGRDNFDGRAAVVMSNHTSLLDIPALMGAVPGSLRMVLKQELTKVPVWGPALVASGFIPVERGTKERAIAQLSEAEKLLEKGVHVWIAPEGTRSRSGELAPFKKGGFHLARSLGAPIIPAWIAGAGTVVPPDRLDASYDGTVAVLFGKPIESNGVEVEALSATVREAMLGLATGAAAVLAEPG